MNDLTVYPGSVEARRFVYAVARRIVGDPDDAEDVTQDAMLLAHRHQASFRGESRYRTWLYRIATTTALTHLRRAKRKSAPIASADAALEVPDPQPLADSQLADRELQAHVHEALATIPPHYREVLLARVDATEPEIARRLDISVANVKIRTHRARIKVREVLAASAA